MIDPAQFKKHTHSYEPGWVVVYIDSPLFLTTSIKFCGVQCGEYIYESPAIGGDLIYKNGNYVDRNGTIFHIYDKI